MAGDDSDEEFHPSTRFDGQDSDAEDEDDSRVQSSNSETDAARIDRNRRLRAAILAMAQAFRGTVGVNVPITQLPHYFLMPVSSVARPFIAGCYDILPDGMKNYLAPLIPAQPIVVFSTAEIMSRFRLTTSAAVTTLSVSDIFASGVSPLTICFSKRDVVKVFGGCPSLLTNVTKTSGPGLYLKGQGGDRQTYGLVTVIYYNPDGEGNYRTPDASNIIETGQQLVECKDGQLRTRIDALLMAKDSLDVILVYDAADGTSLIAILTNSQERRAFFTRSVEGSFTSTNVHDSMTTATGGLYVGARNGQVGATNPALWFLKTMQPGEKAADFTLAHDAQARIVVINTRYQGILVDTSTATSGRSSAKMCIIKDMNGVDRAKFPTLSKAKGKGCSSEWNIKQKVGSRQLTAADIRAATNSLGMKVELQSGSGQYVRIRLVDSVVYQSIDVPEYT